MDDRRVLRVVIASPGDVKSEREIIPRVIDEVNRNIARPRGLHLELHRWETDSYPGFHPEGPQGLIDPILKVEDCDILIGIFWRRFGTPTTDAKSGTEHEFRLAYEAWKKNQKPQIMVYFSQKPHTPLSKKETDQWGLVLQFKEDFPPEGLWCEYPDETKFEGPVRNHLTNFLSDKFPLPAPTTGRQAETVVLSPCFQLPPPPADFTGREAELRDLRAAIETGGVHISGLQGQGGVGKTALALKLAAELAPNFPDAQIYLDLKGVSEKPLTAAEALSHVIRAFHPEAKLPEKEVDLCSLFRSVLHDKRVLLLMDNAKDAAQVKSLIPPEGCTLLVTSRIHFTLPGLYQKDLNTFPPHDATKLLLEIAPRIQPEAEAIAKLCGYLALALRLAATAIAEHIDLSPEEYRQKLADERQRLKLLGGNEEEGVDASIALSYNLLDAETQKRWRMLSVFPDTFDAPAAASVWEIETDAADDEAKATLSRLLQYSMLEWDDATKRYRLHDLMRDFARQQCTAAESDAVALRHATHYGAVLRTANAFYLRGGDSIMPALALFDLEWGNIQAGHAWAQAHALGNDDAAKLCSNYPDWGANVLGLRQHPREYIRWREAALAAAQQLKDREVEGRHLGNLGGAYSDAREHLRAIDYLGKALVIAREVGDRQIEGRVLVNLGFAYSGLDDYQHAIQYLEEGLTVSSEVGDRRGEGMALVRLGIEHFGLGADRRAIDYYARALVIHREVGDSREEGIDHVLIGGANDLLGDYQGAVDHYQEFLPIARKLGDRRGEAVALMTMGMAVESLGDRKKAIEHAEAALKILNELEHPFASDVRKKLEQWRSA